MAEREDIAIEPAGAGQPRAGGRERGSEQSPSDSGSGSGTGASYQLRGNQDADPKSDSGT